MYLREILCRRNLNPTRPIAGENTVNLGGFAKLIRKTIQNRDDIDQQEETKCSMTLGCRFIVEPDKNNGPIGAIWDERYYRSQVSTYSTGAMLPPDANAAFGKPIEYEAAVDDAFSSELWLTIESDDDLPCVQSFQWNINQQQLMSCFRLPSGEWGCWVNPHHKRLDPTLSVIDSNGQSNFWELVAKQAAFSNSADLEDLLSTVGRQVPDLSTESCYAIFTEPLTCPKWNGKFGNIAIQVCEFGADFIQSSLTSVVISLAQADELFLQSKLSRQDWEEFSGDVLIGIDRTRPLDESLGTGTTIVFVAVPEHVAKDAGSILERIRFLFTGTALSGDFLIALDETSLPQDHLPLIDVTDSIGELHGESSGNSWWFPQQLARIDQTVRLAIRQLRTYLDNICYVGPKRSSVPRNFNESVLDEYSSWGNGLGAWRWMLNRSSCPDSVFAKCSQWLSDSEPGLGTGYSLKRDGVLEMTFEQLRLYHDGGLDVDRLKHSMRIELYDARTKTVRHPQEVGEGITQIVPVIASCVRASDVHLGGQLVAIEQPELHLHPSMAARIGDLLLTSLDQSSFRHWTFPPRFLIETHSEHLILRILRRIRQTTNQELPEHLPPVKPDDVCVLWVDNLGDGTTFTRLRISRDGRWLDRWPDGFFSERHEELFE